MDAIKDGRKTWLKPTIVVTATQVVTEYRSHRGVEGQLSVRVHYQHERQKIF